MIKNRKKQKAKSECTENSLFADSVVPDAQKTAEQTSKQNEKPISGKEYRKPVTIKIIIGFISVILAYVAAVMLIVGLTVFADNNDPTLPIVMAILFIALGTAGFFLTVGETNILALIANIASRPSVVIVYLLICVAVFIINAIRDSNIKVPSFSLNRNQSVIVNDGGYKRYLDFKENRTDYDGYGTNPYYGKMYQLYRDDISIYWRSYDDGNTFIKTGYEDKF